MTQLGPTNATLRPSLERDRRTGQAPSASLFPSMVFMALFIKQYSLFEYCTNIYGSWRDRPFTLASSRNHKYKLKVHQTNIQYIKEAIFSHNDVSKVRSLGETSVFSQGKVPSHLVESTIPPFGRDLILVTFGYDEGIFSCGQSDSLDGIDSNANGHSWLTQWGLLLKHHYFSVHYLTIIAHPRTPDSVSYSTN